MLLPIFDAANGKAVAIGELLLRYSPLSPDRLHINSFRDMDDISGRISLALGIASRTRASNISILLCLGFLLICFALF